MSNETTVNQQRIEQESPNAPAQDTDSSLIAHDSSLNPIDEFKIKDLESQVVEVLRTVYDPEIPVNIYEMGLVYDIKATPEGGVQIAMTLTSPACPVAGSLPIEVEQKVRTIPGVTSARVEIVWEPPWTPEKMSEAARLQLGFM
jgi:FeS assembly SUF system protein